MGSDIQVIEIGLIIAKTAEQIKQLEISGSDPAIHLSSAVANSVAYFLAIILMVREMRGLERTIKRISTAMVHQAGRLRPVIISLEPPSVLDFRAKGCSKT